MRRKNGCPSATTSNFQKFVDFIEYFQKKQTPINDDLAVLYGKGLSISDIAEQTGLGRTAVWNQVRKSQKEMRSATSVPFDTWRKRNGKTKARPPYGFCFFEGRVIKSPTEYPTLLLIQSLRKRGHSITEIAEKLAEKKIRSRTGKPWSYNVIKTVHRRFDDGIIAKLIKGNSETKRSKK